MKMTFKKLAGLSGLFLLALSPIVLHAATDTSQWAPLYLSPNAKEVTAGQRFFLGSKGQIYNSNRQQIGYLTDMSGARIDRPPMGGDYQYRRLQDGRVMGQTQRGDGFDANRVMTLAPLSP
jgi:hypothetical protein